MVPQSLRIVWCHVAMKPRKNDTYLAVRFTAYRKMAYTNKISEQQSRPCTIQGLIHIQHCKKPHTIAEELLPPPVLFCWAGSTLLLFRKTTTDSVKMLSFHKLTCCVTQNLFLLFFFAQITLCYRLLLIYRGGCSLYLIFSNFWKSSLMEQNTSNFCHDYQPFSHRKICNIACLAVA